MNANLTICEKCKHHDKVLSFQTGDYWHTCKLIHKFNEYELSWTVPDNCPYFLEHTVSEDTETC